MTFSGDFSSGEVISFVRKELNQLGLFLNENKTVVAGAGRKHSVTGIVVNEKLSVPADYKKKLRQEMHYCMKFGVESHLRARGMDVAADAYILQLLGRVNYVLSVEPDDPHMLAYRAWLRTQQKKRG